MALVFEQINSEGLAQMSYIVGDDKAGVAVIDPRRDVEVYINRARELGVQITHTVETHIHADFVSGTREFAAQTGAEICGGKSADYKFDLVQLKEGDEIELGTVELDATRLGRDAGQIAEAVVQHLEGIVGSKVTVTLEIHAEIPEAVSEQVHRTVTENCRTLKLSDFGFEVEN